MNIAVLAGGISMERDVSLSSATGIAKALKKMGKRKKGQDSSCSVLFFKLCKAVSLWGCFNHFSLELSVLFDFGSACWRDSFGKLRCYKTVCV